MDSTNEPTDADIRVAQRQFLARLEARLSTLHRVIGAFVGGAGLLVLVPIFFKDSFIDTFSILISARDQAQGLADGGTARCEYSDGCCATISVILLDS